MYNRKLEKVIMDDTSGDFKKVLHQLVHQHHKHIMSITSPNDLLDASFKDRMKFFKEQVDRRQTQKSDVGVKWSGLQQQYMVHDADSIADEKNSRFFGGTL